MTDDVAVARAPARTYARLLERPASVTWAQMLRGPLLVLLVIAASVSIAATGRVTASLIATSMLSWSFAVAVQVVAALALIALASSRRVDVATALDLLFLGHLPWSVWLLMAAAAASLDVPRGVIGASVLLPVVWTMIIIGAYGETVLGCPRRRARILVLVHQALIWAFTVNYVVWNAGGWSRFAF